MGQMSFIQTSNTVIVLKHCPHNRMTPVSILSFILWQLLGAVLLPQTCSRNSAAAAAGGGGKWALVKSSVGISAMHMQLLRNDKVVMFDQTGFSQSNISLPNGNCRNDSALKSDCTAHSVEYDVVQNTIRPLTVLTDVLCSSGSVMPDGTLYQTGGFNAGGRVVRVYAPCNNNNNSDSCDWREINNGLAAPRWYATNHALPGGRQIIIGGRRQFNYEFYPKTAATNRFFNLPFLRQTNDPGVENNLYPLVFLNTDGNLFIFANTRAILFNANTGAVVKMYPQLPDGNPRSYPSTGSGVLLPLKNLQAEVLICGGAPKGAFESVRNGSNFITALKTCGRIDINSRNPKWVMEDMPLARVMGDMILLPNGKVLIINGAASGTAGWEYARDPVLSPVIYQPDGKPGARFQVQTPSSRPRLYHSTAILLRDGRVLVGGSNPHIRYVYTNTTYPTDLSLEAFSPPYLDPGFDTVRPRIVAPASQSRVGYGRQLILQFKVAGQLKAETVAVTMVSPSFTTHSVSMNQRLLVLGGGGSNVKSVANSTYQTVVTTPASSNLAISGYHLMYVVHQDVPSDGIWVQLM